MNQSLQVFTPTSHPLNYDSLAQREGCEPESGLNILGSLAFTTMCVFSHKANDRNFSQLDTVSYQVGPNVTGEPQPQLNVWTAWLSMVGVRIGIVGSVVPPAASLGETSSLFPSIIGTKVTHAFDGLGLLHIAVSKPSGFIDLRRYADTEGRVVSTAFLGISPLLINLGNVSPSGESGVVCYYLRSDRSFSLFARFAQEDFEVEHEVMPNLRANLTRLISIKGLGNLVKLYATDELGRDVTLTSPPYPLTNNEAATLEIGFVSGHVDFMIAAAEDAGSKGKCTINFTRGAMYDATAETATVPEEKAKLDIDFESGEMTLST